VVVGVSPCCLCLRQGVLAPSPYDTEGGACSALNPDGREVWRDGVVRDRRVMAVGLVMGLGHAHGL